MTVAKETYHFKEPTSHSVGSVSNAGVVKASRIAPVIRSQSANEWQDSKVVREQGMGWLRLIIGLVA